MNVLNFSKILEPAKNPVLGIQQCTFLYFFHGIDYYFFLKHNTLEEDCQIAVRTEYLYSIILNTN